jgi:hypothetical protein
MPFDGTPPAVRPGDAIEVRAADGNWHPARCGSEPRYDEHNGLGWRVWLTVRADAGNGWVNWPAEDVRPAAHHRARLAAGTEEG